MISNKHKLALASAMVIATIATASAQQKDYLPIDRPAESPYQLRASDLIDMDVENLNGDEIGEIDDLIISNGKVPNAVISVGGFLGMGEKLVAVPYNELRVDNEGEHIVYDATEDQLKSLPEFNYMEGESRWSDLRAERLALQEQSEEAIQDVKQATEQTVENVQHSEAWNEIAGNWNQLKGKVKQQWGELTDDDLTVIEGNRDMLVGKIQEHYGVSREEAEQQVNDWAATM